MKAIKQKSTIVVIVVTVLSLGSAAALAASALTPEGPNGRISACYSDHGSLRLVSAGSSCGERHSISWVGHLIQATVNSDGSFGNSWGVSNVTHTPGSGIYDIYLNPGTYNGCVETATLAFNPGQVSIEGIPNANLQVQTYDASGVAADQTFQFMMSCA